jgi:hypothetical protein
LLRLLHLLGLEGLLDELAVLIVIDRLLLLLLCLVRRLLQKWLEGVEERSRGLLLGHKKAIIWLLLEAECWLWLWLLM